MSRLIAGVAVVIGAVLTPGAGGGKADQRRKKLMTVITPLSRLHRPSTNALNIMVKGTNTNHARNGAARRYTMIVSNMSDIACTRAGGSP
jgi:hypothetical protein